MTPIRLAALAALLLLAPMTRADAACVNTKCSDTASIEQARARIQETCGCQREGQTHRTYKKCVKATLKAADLTALIPAKACRKLIMKCENASICGKPGAAICCAQKRNGRVKGKVVKNAGKCRTGSACGAFLGLYSKFDACNETDATCAGPTTTTTLPTTTTTVVPSTTTTTVVVPTTTSSTSTTTSTAPTTTTTSTTLVTTTSTTTTSIVGTTTTSTTVGTTTTSTTLVPTTTTSTTTSTTVIPTTTTSTTEPPTTTTSTSSTTTSTI